MTSSPVLATRARVLAVAERVAHFDRSPAAQEYDAMIAAAAIMIALVVWAALSAVRLVVRGLLVLAFLPYYLRRR